MVWADCSYWYSAHIMTREIRLGRDCWCQDNDMSVRVLGVCIAGWPGWESRFASLKGWGKSEKVILEGWKRKNVKRRVRWTRGNIRDVKEDIDIKDDTSFTRVQPREWMDLPVCAILYWCVQVLVVCYHQAGVMSAGMVQSPTPEKKSPIQNDQTIGHWSCIYMKILPKNYINAIYFSCMLQWCNLSCQYDMYPYF